MMLTSHNRHYRIFFLGPPETVVTTWTLSSHVHVIYINMSSETGPMQSLAAQLALRILYC